jgi:uncharacterized membrane protein YccC
MMEPYDTFAERERAYHRQNILREAEERRLARLARAGQQQRPSLGAALNASLSALAARLRSRARSVKPHPVAKPGPRTT